MTTTYKLNAKELSNDLIQSIKEAFKDKDIEITISDYADETEYLLSTEANKRHLSKSMGEIEKGDIVEMTLAELQEKYLK
jgi:antitoxin YefM